MDEECSAAAPIRGSVPSRDPGHVSPREHLWTQAQLWDASEIVITSRLVVDGPGGLLTASVDCTSFWDGTRLACEVRPALRFPHDRLVALAWIEALCIEWSDRAAPF
jgi:hypothetical protein